MQTLIGIRASATRTGLDNALAKRPHAPDHLGHRLCSEMFESDLRQARLLQKHATIQRVLIKCRNAESGKSA